MDVIEDGILDGTVFLCIMCVSYINLYHLFISCNPKVENVPEGSWLCPLCANCHSCDEHGMEEESQYTHATAPKSDRYKYPVYLATYCPKCNGNFEDDRFCTVCLKTYSEEEENDDEDNEMVACDTCDHWVHTRCDEQLTPEKYQILCDDEEAKYKCPMCEDRFKRLVDTSTADLALKGLSAPSGFAVGLLGGKVVSLYTILTIQFYSYFLNRSKQEALLNLKISKSVYLKLMVQVLQKCHPINNLM